MKGDMWGAGSRFRLTAYNSSHSRLLKRSRKWPKNPIVMLSEAKHLLCFHRQKKQVLRSAQDDNSSLRTIRGFFQQPDR